MSYTVKPDQGLHFSFGPWPNCVIAAYDTGGVGQVVFVGTAPVGSMDFTSLGFAFGPGDIASAVASAGSFGAFLMGLIPTANAVMAAYLDQHPSFAPITNADPPTIDNVNIALQEYFQINPSSDGDYPVMSFKPYP